MAEITIDVSEDDGDSVAVINERGFNLTIQISGLSIEISNEQAEVIYRELKPWFEEEPTNDN